MQFVFRVEPDVARLLEEVSELLRRTATVGDASRSAILRSALRRGLDQMKAELGSRTKKRS